MRRAPLTRAPENRRDEILLAALRVIGRGGVDSLTFRSVAQEAGIPHGSITYRFDSREEVILEAFRFYLADLHAAAQAVEKELRDAENFSGVEAVLAMSARDLEQPEIARAEYEMYVYAARDDALARDIEHWDAVTDAMLARPLEDAGIPRPLEAARTIRGTVRGFEIERLSRDVDLDELRRRLQIVFTGLLVDEPPSA